MGYPAKGQADFLELGDWNAVCAQCNRKRKASTMRQLPAGVPGAGMFVCFPEHWDARHPQEFVRAVPDNMTVPWAQPPSPSYTAFCTPNGQSAVPGMSQPGCMVPGYLSLAYNPESPI